MNIEVHIERVTLEGFTFGNAGRAALSHALARDLRALIEAGGIPPGLLARPAMPSLPAGSVKLPAAPAPGGIGSAMANAVYTSFRGA